ARDSEEPACNILDRSVLITVKRIPPASPPNTGGRPAAGLDTRGWAGSTAAHRRRVGAQDPHTRPAPGTSSLRFSSPVEFLDHAGLADRSITAPICGSHRRAGRPWGSPAVALRCWLRRRGLGRGLGPCWNASAVGLDRVRGSEVQYIAFRTSSERALS